MSESLTPVAVETKLRQLVTELTHAQQALAEARDTEVEAKHGYESARRAALLAENRPRVERGGWTTADEDHLRVTRDQASVVQTLARSVQQAFSMAGVSER